MMRSLYFSMDAQDGSAGFVNRKPSVLCFEESPRMMRLAMWLLSGDGYDVIWAKTADEFLKLASFYQPKLILIEQKQQLHVSAEFLQKINQFIIDHNFPKKIGLVLDDQNAEFRLVENLTAVSIEQLLHNDLAEWLNQYKQTPPSTTSVPICE